jgi:NADPH2:quinone reductase
VDVAAAAANFPDVLLVADKYQITVPLPFIPGSELAGTVRSVGPGVTQWSIGDRVMGSTLVGAFAQRVALPATSLVSVPDGIELWVAAAAGVAHRTAYHALRTMGGVTAGDQVVVLGAAGGVGLAAVELAVVLGATVTAVASSESKRRLCVAKGAGTAIDPDAPDLKEQLKAATNGGAEVVVDPVGGPYAETALRAMRWGGRFVSVGFASGEIPRIPLNLVLLKGVHVTGFTMGGISANQPVETARDSAELAELLATGRVTPHVSARYPLSETAQALNDLAERRATGKVLVLPND